MFGDELLELLNYIAIRHDIYFPFKYIYIYRLH